MRGGTALVRAEVDNRVGTSEGRVVPSSAGIWFAPAGDSLYTFALNEVTVGDNPTASVSGTVSLQLPDPNASPISFSVQGTHGHPAVSWQLSRPDHPDATYAGVFTSDTTIDGRLEGVGPSARDLRLSRPTCYCPFLVAGRLAPMEQVAASCCTGA